MKCPDCGQHTADAWANLGYIPGTGGKNGFTSLQAEWMHCANPECKSTMIRMIESHFTVETRQGEVVPFDRNVTWLARPRYGSRPVDSEVPEPYRTDYLEAAAILETSPRMSAVLSRRIMADLLEKYGNYDDYNLKDRIDKFAADKTHPGDLRQSLHHVREIANFGAHTQTDDQAAVIEIDREDAEWTLDLLDRLFEYFILTPERDRTMRAAVEKRMAEAGRKPLS